MLRQSLSIIALIALSLIAVHYNENISVDRLPASSEVSTEVNELQKCVHHTGYGTFTGFGATMSEARSAASTQCFNQMVNIFEKTRQRLPTTDEAELILTEQCLNICS